MPPRRPPRATHSGAETRAAILDAADALLRAHGPAKVRLDAVAAEVGISRQAVLHHFGSRDGLMRAAVGRAWAALFADLKGLGDGETPSIGDAIERVDEAARLRGNARIGAWLLLSGSQLPPEAIVDQLVDLPGRLVAVPEGSVDAEASDKEARYVSLLMAAALFGDAIFGGRFREVFGLEDGEAARADFRLWLGERLARV